SAEGRGCEYKRPMSHGVAKESFAADAAHAALISVTTACGRGYTLSPLTRLGNTNGYYQTKRLGTLNRDDLVFDISSRAIFPDCPDGRRNPEDPHATHRRVQAERWDRRGNHRPAGKKDHLVWRPRERRQAAARRRHGFRDRIDQQGIHVTPADRHGRAR